MKKILVLLITTTFSLAIFAQGNYGKPLKTEISTALADPLVLHTEKSWKLNKVNGGNKMDLFVEAVEYSSNGVAVKKGVKVILIPENAVGIEQSSNQFVSYIQKSEYSEVLVVLNQMLVEYKKLETEDIQASMSYITKGGIEFGFVNTDIKEVACISIIYDNAKFTCEYYDIDDFLADLRDNIDTASKDLHLPENAEKLKKAKKGNQEVKDVIIDDI